MGILSIFIFLLFSVSGARADVFDTLGQKSCALTIPSAGSPLQHVNLSGVTEWAFSFQVPANPAPAELFSIVFSAYDVPSDFSASSYSMATSDDHLTTVQGIEFDLASAKVTSYFNFPGDTSKEETENVVGLPTSGNIYFWIDVHDDDFFVFFSASSTKPANHNFKLQAAFEDILKCNERLYVGFISNYQVAISDWRFTPCLPLPAIVGRFGQMDVQFNDFHQVDLSLGNQEFATFFQWELNGIDQGGDGFSLVITNAPFPSPYVTCTTSAGYDYNKLDGDSIAISIVTDGGRSTQVVVRKYIKSTGTYSQKTSSALGAGNYFWFKFDQSSQKLNYGFNSNARDGPMNPGQLDLDISDITFDSGVGYVGFVTSLDAFKVKAWEFTTAAQNLAVAPFKLISAKNADSPLIVPPYVSGIRNFITFYADLNNPDINVTVSTSNKKLFIPNHEPKLDLTTGSISFLFNESAHGQADIEVSIIYTHHSKKRYDVYGGNFTASTSIQKCETKFTDRHGVAKKIVCYRFLNAQCDEFRMEIVDYRESDEFQPGDVFEDKYLDCDCVLQETPSQGGATYAL